MNGRIPNWFFNIVYWDFLALLIKLVFNIIIKVKPF